MLQTGALAIPLGGCLLSGDLPEPNLVIPASYDMGPKSPVTAQASLPPLDWWNKFRSRELTAIIEEARANNLDIAAAVARIVQADAQARIAGAPLLPLITANGNATNSQASLTTTKANIITIKQNGGITSGKSGAALSNTPTNSLQATLNASYEIDFWGKNRAALRNAEELAVASRYDREVVGLTTTVAAANAYFQVLASQDRLRISKENLESASRILNLINQRAQAGTASALEIAQQESLVNQVKASIPPLEEALYTNRSALAVLMGRSPEQVRIRGGSLHSIAIPRVTPGLPSSLLGQRPDIREAEANLAAANANVYNARAQMLPSITLTGDGGYESAVLRALMRPESVIFTAAAGLTQPIFEGGRLLGNIDLQTAKQDELLQDYRKAIISAFSDVETGLYNVRQTALTVQLQQAVVTSSRRAFDVSEQRLREGTIDLVTVLQTEQTLFTAEDALAQAQLARLQAIVSLYQALGGGWLPEPVEASNAR
ncbi:MAG TPA: efflux transporter outer membrane subunit [Pseudolabrys sp.]|nr:efflux transporter outer membrane subunit [Pseudolabrys sp.]